MKTKLFAAALAALTLASASAAGAQEFRRGDGWRHRAEITIRNDGRTFSFDRGDRMFYRLLDRPYHFRPGMTYAYTDRCNRFGCVVIVFDDFRRRPVDRIFAPHLPMRGYAWRQARGFDGSYRAFGRFDRDERGWTNDDDRRYREQRDRDRDGDRRGGGRGLEGGTRR
jgi:hypothetical protein